MNERHLVESLDRALRGRGHKVYKTGPVWSGWRPPRQGDETERVQRVIDDVIAWKPEVLLAIRTSGLRVEDVERFKRKGILSLAWFSDDPVLYKVHTSKVATAYDVTLHTATAPVLQMYEHELGARGIGFPFWTDDVAMPHLYDPNNCEVDVVFAGNTHTRVKQWRYDWLASLPLKTAIYGKVVDDPAKIHMGYVDGDSALARACARGLVGISLAQRFKDYSGTRFDYDGLSAFGEFSLPSRIVQLSAIGVPTVVYTNHAPTVGWYEETFPPAYVCGSRQEVIDTVVSLREKGPDALTARSTSGREWYLRHYTADVRALFLEAIARKPDDWQRRPVGDRARSFMDVERSRRTPGELWNAGARATVGKMRNWLR